MNILTDPSFTKFCQLLDANMKQLKSTGMFQKKAADVITEAMEDRLWELQLLGDHDPQTLLDTFFYRSLFRPQRRRRALTASAQSLLD